MLFEKNICVNISLLVSCTVNPLLSPQGAYCFKAHWGGGGGGGLNRKEGLNRRGSVKI